MKKYEGANDLMRDLPFEQDNTNSLSKQGKCSGAQIQLVHQASVLTYSKNTQVYGRGC